MQSVAPESFGSPDRNHSTFGITRRQAHAPHEPDCERIPLSSLTVTHTENPTQPLELHLHFATSFQPTSRWSREVSFFSLIVKIPLVFEKLDKQMDHRSQLCSLPELGYFCEAGWGYPAQEVSMADHLFFSHEKISVEDDELMKWTRLPLF